MSVKNLLAAAQVGYVLSTSGEQIYTTAGTYSWVCPAGITSVGVVCVGGGGYGNGYGASGGALAWNNITVSPGSSYSVVVGAAGVDGPVAGGTSSFNGTSAVANGGTGLPFGNDLKAGGTFSAPGGGGGAGGAGGAENYEYRLPGVGGAGGYSGAGGRGGSSNELTLPSAGAGGGGGGTSGGFDPMDATAHVSGGGVGLYGVGTSGAAGTKTVPAGGGSGGQTGVLILVPSGAEPSSYQDQPGANYGSGATGNKITRAGAGAVRIIWGPGRSFPNNAA